MPRRHTTNRMLRRTRFVLVVSAIVMAVSIGLLTLFYYLVEGRQGGLDRTPFDWLYFTVITTRTIGFGDITPQTWLGKLGTIFNALLPASLFFGASLVVLEAFFSALETGYKRWRMHKLNGHTVVVADEELMTSIVQEIRVDGRPFVCILDKPLDELPPRLQGVLDDSTYTTGDPTRDEVLRGAGIERARSIVIATPEDSVNLYVLVTARALAPEIKTVVRVNRLETESKFRSVGADVLLPAGTMLGRQLSQAATHPVAQDLLVRLQTGTEEPFLHEEPIGSDRAGLGVREAIPRAVALYRDGAYRFDLEGVSLAEGDVVLRIG